MEHEMEINHSSVPVRLFQSDFLEMFTHVHPVVVLILWIPYTLAMLFWGVSARPQGTGLLYLPACFAVGVFIWTLAEYNIHRFFFHYTPRTDWQERIVFLFHGIHHLQPRLKTRLVMPPAASIPMGAIFFGLFYLTAGRWLGMMHWVGPLLAGFTVGYIVYDMMHYATHHFAMRRGKVFRYLKRHHMLHHYKTPNMRFGVSSPLWDWVYGTLPKDD